MPETSADLGAVTAVDLLSADRRLAAVVAVEESAEPVSSDELAMMTAAAEHGRPPGQLGGRSARSVKADLESDHLPRLVAHGVLRDAAGGYEAGAKMDGLLSVVDEVLDRSGDSSPLATDERQPGDRVPPAVGGSERAGDTDI